VALPPFTVVVFVPSANDRPLPGTHPVPPYLPLAVPRKRLCQTLFRRRSAPCSSRRAINHLQRQATIPSSSSVYLEVHAFLDDIVCFYSTSRRFPPSRASLTVHSFSHSLYTLPTALHSTTRQPSSPFFVSRVGVPVLRVFVNYISTLSFN